MIRSLLFLFILFPFILVDTAGARKLRPKTETIIYSRQDSILAENILSCFAGREDQPAARLVAEIGKMFLGTPYVGQTLENGAAERLVVNLRELDCTTFAENCLALTLTVKSGKPDFRQFTKEIEKIRYRKGKRDGYLSRLHYFSDWIRDNEQKGLVSEPATYLGSPLTVKVNFMSSHPKSYPVLADHPELIPELAGQEKAISGRNYYFLKKEDVRSNEAKLQEGDLIGITTSIPGLDITHVGILIRQNGRIHLLHASSALAKVVISEDPLSDLLMKKKSYTGIMIARPQ